MILSSIRKKHKLKPCQCFPTRGGYVFKEGIITKLQSGGKGILKKQLLIIGTTLVLIIVGFSGCTDIFSGQKWQGGTYTDPDGLFSFEAPKGWLIDEYESDSRSKVTFDSPDSDMSIVIIVEPYNKSTNITDEDKHRMVTAGTIYEGSIIIDEVEGYEILVTYNEKGIPTWMGDYVVNAVAYIKNGYWHTITFGEPTSPDRNPIWDQIINSFKNIA